MGPRRETKEQGRVKGGSREERGRNKGMKKGRKEGNRKEGRGRKAATVY